MDIEQLSANGHQTRTHPTIAIFLYIIVQSLTVIAFMPLLDGPGYGRKGAKVLL